MSDTLHGELKDGSLDQVDGAGDEDNRSVDHRIPEAKTLENTSVLETEALSTGVATRVINVLPTRRVGLARNRHILFYHLISSERAHHNTVFDLRAVEHAEQIEEYLRAEHEDDGGIAPGKTVKDNYLLLNGVLRLR